VRFLMSHRFLLTAVAAGLAFTAVPGAAHAAPVPGWRVYARISPDRKEVQLNAVTALSPGNAWAVGDITNSVLIEHWNGKAWQQMAIPAKLTGALYAQYPGLSSVAADSTSNLWAFNPVGGWLRWNGSRWSSGKLPDTSVNLAMNMAVATGKDQAWAFGAVPGTAGYKGYAAFFNGRSWKAMTVPGPANVNGVLDASALSPSDIWAITGGGPGTGIPVSTLVHWNGHVWRAQPLPAALRSAANLASVLAFKDGSVWVGGQLPAGRSGATAVAARWNGRTWLVMHLPGSREVPADLLSSMVSDGHGGIWAFGENCGCESGPFWHYTDGTWAGPSLVTGVDGGPWGPQALAQVPGTDSIWSAGGAADRATIEDGLILLYGPVPGE
jgi:hypothetical protein